METTEMITMIGSTLSAISLLTAGIWFLMSRSRSWGTKTKELEVVTDAIKDLQKDMKEGFNNVHVEIKDVRA